MDIKDTSRSETLTSIVCPIERSDRRKQLPSALVVSYDAKRRRASAPGFKLFDSSEYYRVDPNATAIYRPQRIEIHDGEDGEAVRRASLSVSLVLRAAPGHEFQLVEAVASHELPSHAVDELVYAIVQKEILLRRARRQPVLAEFRTWRSELVQRVQEGLSGIGFNANVTIEAWNPYQVKSHEISSTIISRCSDHGGGVEIAVSLLVDPAAGGELERALNPFDDEGMKTALLAVIADCHRRSVDVNMLCLRRLQVERLLQTAANDWLKERGWSLAHFNAELRVKFSLPPDQFDETFIVSCMPRGRDKAIAVEHRILLRLIDPLRALSEAGIDPLAEIKAVTNRATIGCLFDRSYVDIVLAFDEKRKQDAGNVVTKVAEEVRAHARRLGYDVVHLTALPGEQPNLLQRDGVHLMLPAERLDEMAGERFELKDPRIKGNVLIDVDARLPELEKLTNLISSQQDLEQGMQALIRREAARILLTVTPHRFHMAFNVARDDKPALSEELADAITRALKSVYFLDHIHTTVRLGMTPLLKRMLDLARGQRVVTTSFVLADENGVGETARFEVRYAVDGIDESSESAWFVFQARDFPDTEAEKQAIDAILSSEVKRYLDSASTSLLRESALRNDAVQRTLAARMRSKVAEELGLAIIVGVILPQDTEYAEAVLDAGKEARAHWLDSVGAMREKDAQYVEALAERRQTLLDRRRYMEEAGEFDPAEAERLEKEIESLNETLKPVGATQAVAGWTPPPGGKAKSSLMQIDRIFGQTGETPETPTLDAGSAPTAEKTVKEGAEA